MKFLIIPRLRRFFHCLLSLHKTGDLYWNHELACLACGSCGRVFWGKKQDWMEWPNSNV